MHSLDWDQFIAQIKLQSVFGRSEKLIMKVKSPSDWKTSKVFFWKCVKLLVTIQQIL